MQSLENNDRNAQNASSENHHMMPKCSVYFSDIYHLREEPIFQVKLTREGHKCQHDILHKVFGVAADRDAKNLLNGDGSHRLEAAKKGGAATRDSGMWEIGLNAAHEQRRKKVMLVSPDGLKTIHESATAASVYLGTSHSAISACCNGKTKTTMKHEAKYV